MKMKPALGYVQYVYNTVGSWFVRNSNYIRIADVLTSQPTRFVSGSCSGT